MSSTPPGWYDDRHGARRWWDGARWTEHTQPGEDRRDVTALDDAGIGAGAPAPGTPEPRRSSRMWIVWVVIGVVVLGMVIAAIVLIPMLLTSLVGAAGGGTEPGDADERAAVDAVELYDDAWSEVDCDKFFAATTESFRAQIGLPDCAAFEGEAQGFSESIDDYDIEVTGITRAGGTITVATTETYLSLTDDENQPLATPEPTEVHYEYYVVADGERWAIDDAASD